MQTFLITIGSFALALLIGTAYQALGTRHDRKRHPAPGKFVSLSTHKLHLLEMGSGDPTILLESGLMGTVLTWEPIQRELAKSTHVVSYDRAGLGWSECGPGPRTAEKIATELHDMLRHAEIPPPYILVGHSFGGLTTRVFAARYPKEVAGLLLVDPVVAGGWSPLSEENRKRVEVGAKICRRSVWLSQSGVIRFVAFLLRMGAGRLANPLIRLMSKEAPSTTGSSSSPLFWNLPANEREVAQVFWVQPKFSRTIASQLEQLPTSATQAANGKCGSIPMVVISAGNAPASQVEEHRALAKASCEGKHLVATQSGHWIMVDQPQLVLTAIRDLLQSVRNTAPSSKAPEQALRTYA